MRRVVADPPAHRLAGGQICFADLKGSVEQAGLAHDARGVLDAGERDRRRKVAPDHAIAPVLRSASSAARS
jgi:hypothetical protein